MNQFLNFYLFPKFSMIEHAVFLTEKKSLSEFDGVFLGSGSKRIRNSRLALAV